MLIQDFPEFCLRELLGAGAKKAQCYFTDIEKHELNVEIGELSLLRTMCSSSVRLEVVNNGRRGVVSVSGTVPGDIAAGAKAAVAASKAALPDKSWDIAARQPAQRFSNGLILPDKEKMCSRVLEFLKETRKQYPKIRIRDAALEFTKKSERVLNSDGVDMVSVYGAYKLSVNFAAQDNGKSSSINYFSVGLPDLSRPLMQCGSLGVLFQHAERHTHPSPLKGKFSGDIVVMPHCLDYFVEFVCGQALSSKMIIPGTSVYRNKCGKKIACENLTLRSVPLSHEMSDGYYFTQDGYKVANTVIVEKGMLKSFLLDSYGARKSGLTRAANDGGCLTIDPGSERLVDLIRKVKKGLLIPRFSGAAPSEAGDFSGVAKNSFYIENGKIRYPISETMVSGNIPDMLKRINGISSERVNLGRSEFPWISFSGAVVSGK
ncbi:MAG: peptidase [Elusimicrobia bacterium HGW-Elusimicrobia-3]|jgi:PmbA protein|nr:MAG: peptidase [Elusimicrobia bacterium HGW-Elusimicrobia-3]